jgi:hypothetical protein
VVPGLRQPATQAAINKSLTQSNKSPTGSNATNKRPAARRNSSGLLSSLTRPIAGSALPVFYRPLVARVALKLNMSWHNPDLYLVLSLLAGLATLLAIIYECIQRRKPARWKRTKPLDGLRRDRPSLSALSKLRNRFRRRLTPGEVHRLEQRSRTRL